MGKLDGKVAIVTGAASGIGQQVALRFAQEGAAVTCADLKEATTSVERIQDAGGRAIYVRTDVRDEDQVREMAGKTKATFGRMDVLANVAGVVSPSGVDNVVELTADDWDFVVNTDLRGVWLCMKHAAPRMIEQGGGKIINVASNAALVGLTNLAAYFAAKGGVVALTRQAAVDLAPHNIQVNAVAPGITETPILGDITPEMREAFSQMVLARRLGRPEEQAAAICYLASDEADFITGHVLVVDSGWSMRG